MNSFTAKFKIDLAEGMTIREINNPDSEKYTLVLSKEDNELYGLGNRTIIKISETDMSKYECTSVSKFTDIKDYFIVGTEDGEKTMDDNELLSHIKNEAVRQYPVDFSIQKKRMSREEYIVASDDPDMRYIRFRDSIASKYKELQEMCITYVVQDVIDDNVEVAIYETKNKNIEPTEDHYKGRFTFSLADWEAEKQKSGNRVFINPKMEELKKKFETGKYICLFTNEHICRWHIDTKPSFIPSNKYKLILKKHEKFLNAFLVGRGIEYNSGYGWSPVPDFIDKYAEHINYRIKNPKATLKAALEAYTSISWSCSCGYRNIKEEGQIDLDDGDNVFCGKCNKEYIFDRKKLEFVEDIRD